jgi:hypothetical protein
MKKIIALVAVALVTVSMVCAQIGLTVGAKGNFGMNLGSQVDEKTDGMKAAFAVNGGGSIYGRYNMPFLPALGVQLEVGMTFGNAIGEAKDNKNSRYNSYNSFDIPLLVTYDIPVSSIVITPMLGMNFSIPFGAPTAHSKTDGEKDSEKMDDYKVTGFIPGLVAGVEVAIPAGPGSITAGLSYVNDFTPVKGKAEFMGTTIEREIGIRRNLNISAGYAIKL